MRPLTLSLLLSIAVANAASGGWLQWGRNGRHDSNSPAVGHPLGRIEAELVVDPHAELEKQVSGGVLLVHYQVPLIDGDDLYLVLKGGEYTSNTQRQTQTWGVRNVRRNGTSYNERWNYRSDWKPVQSGNRNNNEPGWEPVYHAVLTADAIWVPGFGGTIDKVSRATGTLIQRFNPHGNSIDERIFAIGPPVADDAGNIYYHAIKLTEQMPFLNDPEGAWLVKIAANGTMSRAAWSSLVTGAVAADAMCNTQFAQAQLPWPPAPDAVVPTARCGAQRPGVNVSPAVGPDGTIYTVSRAHRNQKYGYLVAVNPDLTPKWTTTLRERFLDGCNVLTIPTGQQGGCRAGTTNGYDPTENRPGSGGVSDDSTSSPMVLPDGKILYGAYSRYNYQQGHLMMFAGDGTYERAYPFGWDLTPAVYQHDGTYSILIKENHYNGHAFCGGNAANCPPNRSQVAPNDPEQYLITRLDANLRVEWQYRNRETQACERLPNGTMNCEDNGPQGFEWCVNAIAVDADGTVFANSEDGHLYAINRNGALRHRMFLRLALGAAYTPLSIGDDGRIYTQNDGRVFVVTGSAKRRASDKP
ncbi:MAG TPA: hypothetical protein VF698_14670 [Thermoanaerobaculia bacterium]|jgi:outer membrane protein assembly factor BamB